MSSAAAVIGALRVNFADVKYVICFFGNIGINVPILVGVIVSQLSLDSA